MVRHPQPLRDILRSKVLKQEAVVPAKVGEETKSP